MNLHFGTATAVRLIDYLAGMSAGKYVRSNPRDFRLKRYSQHAPQSKEPEKKKTDKIFDQLLKLNIKRSIEGNQKRLDATDLGNPFLIDLGEESPTSNSSNLDPSDNYRHARAVLAQIEQMLTEYYGKEFAQGTIMHLINASNIKQDYSPIYEAFERHRRNIGQRFWML